MAATIPHKLPRGYRTSVTTTAKPLTQVHATSSGNTTYTATRVTDASAWTLTNVLAGDIVVTSDGYLGLVTSTGSNLVNVQEWFEKKVSARGFGANMPADTSTAMILRCLRCKRIEISAVEANSAIVAFGFSDAVTLATSREISHTAANPNSVLVLEAGVNELLDCREMWIIAASTQNVNWLAT